MKRLLLSLFLTLVVIFAVSACKNSDEQNGASQETVNTAQQSETAG